MQTVDMGVRPISLGDMDDVLQHYSLQDEDRWAYDTCSWSGKEAAANPMSLRYALGMFNASCAWPDTLTLTGLSRVSHRGGRHRCM